MLVQFRKPCSDIQKNVSPIYKSIAFTNLQIKARGGREVPGKSQYRFLFLPISKYAALFSAVCVVRYYTKILGF